MGNFNQGGSNRGGFNKGGRDSGRPSFQKRSFSGKPEGRGDTELFKATCSECGKSCEVPFRPTNGKPVFCKECFAGKRAGEERAPRREFNDRGRGAERPSRPSFETSPRPVADNSDMKRQLEVISVKLDRLISAIEGMSHTHKPVVVAKPAAVVKTVSAPAPKKIVAKKIAPKKVAKKAKK